MLLNASHELTNCGLPDHIQDRYVRYKQGNRAIVAWMTRYGPEKFKGRKTLPIKQLIALGTSLCNKIDEIGTLPSDVDFYFKEVIRERAYLSQHFREFRDCSEKDQIDTINHEHFTNSLKQIHEILLTAGKPASRTKTIIRKPIKSRVSSSSPMTSPKNSFAHLLISTHDQVDSGNSDDSDNDTSSDAETNATSECSHSLTEHSLCPCDNSENDADFLDSEGSLGIAVETTIFLKDISQTSNAIRSCWVKAGQGSIPLAAAAAYTSVLLGKAIAATKSFCQVDTNTVQLPDWRSRLNRLRCMDHYDPESVGNEIHDVSKALCNVYDELDAQSSPTSANAVQTKPSVVEHTADPKSLFDALISSLRLAHERRGASSLTFGGIPFPTELFLEHAHLESISSMALSTSVIIYMISVSHCAYSTTLSQPSHIAVPRITALKLANEAFRVVKSFVDDKSIFPCQCTNTLGYRVVQMGKELEAFARYKCWDVVSQSPLVAGNHLLEIHDLCSYYGMHLFHYRQYVAAVLHTYQALTKLNALETIPIMEEVCELFTSVLYTTGTRPESGFMASWQRYIGARLRFKKGKKHLNHKDTWCMSIPAHAAARSAGLNVSERSEDTKIQPKFDYGTIDQVIKVKRDGWLLDEELSGSLDDELKVDSIVNNEQSLLAQRQESSSPSQKTKRNKHARTKTCCVDKEALGKTCSRLDHTFAASFTADAPAGRTLPPSRFNLLSFFHSMTKVVTGISDYTHTEDGKTGNSGKGQMCLCFVQTILQASDRILDVRKRIRIDAKGSTWSKNEKQCIDCYKKFLTRMLEEAGVLGGYGGVWLWSSM